MSRSGREDVFDEFMGEWSADEPSGGFAERLAHAAVMEQKLNGRGRWGGKQVIVPIFLAALCLSFGAAAAWDTYSFDQPSLTRADDEAVRAPSERHVQVLFTQDEVSAEREQTDESASDAEPVKKAPVPDQVTRSAEPPQKRRQLHLPRCECSTSAIVCTCSE